METLAQPIRRREATARAAARRPSTGKESVGTGTVTVNGVAVLVIVGVLVGVFVGVLVDVAVGVGVGIETELTAARASTRP